MPGASEMEDDLSRVRVANWVREQEDRSAHLLIECDPYDTEWTRLCLRQADLVLLVARADDDPEATRATSPAGEELRRSARRELVLVHPPATDHPSGTERWLRAAAVDAHHHVRADRADDFRRLARSISKRSVGLAVSGGGARSYAHVGVIRALSERGLPVDLVGGTSAGAFIASFLAMGHDVDSMLAFSRKARDRYKISRDLTFPTLSFLSARHVVATLQGMFGDAYIEDLWIPFFCVSTNLNTVEMVVHDRGPIWEAIRATIAVPGILPPLFSAGEPLVDGGILNNLPIDVVRGRGCGTVVASDVSLVGELKAGGLESVSTSGWSLLWSRLAPWKERSELPHVFEILMRTATASGVYHRGRVMREADLYVRTEAADIPTLDWEAGEALIDRAYHLAIEEIARWQASRGESA